MNKSTLGYNNNLQYPKYGLVSHLRRSSGSKSVGVESIFQTSINISFNTNDINLILLECQWEFVTIKYHL